MAVELKVLDMDNQEVSLDTGIDMGLARKGRATVVPFKIKNEGNLSAREMIIEATTLNQPTDVEDGLCTEEEYYNQVKAKGWKTFSLDPEIGFKRELIIPIVKPGSFINGVKTTVPNMQSVGVFPFDTQHELGTTQFIGERMILSKAELSGYASKRINHNLPSIKRTKHCEVSFCVEFDWSDNTETWKDGEKPFVFIPMRHNSRGDGKGYGFLLELNRDTKTYNLTIRKGAEGMTTHYERDMGAILFYTQNFAYNKNDVFTFSLYNDINDVPNFEAKRNNSNLKLFANVGSASGNIMTDKSATNYSGTGDFYFDCAIGEGDISMALSEIKLMTDELEQPVYMRTIIGDDAENDVHYKSSVFISYLED